MVPRGSKSVPRMVLRGSVPSAGAPRCIAAASCEGSAEPRCTVLSWCEFASVVCLRRRLTGGKSGGALVRRMAAKVARSATQAEKSAGLTPKSKSMAKRNSSSRELSSAMGRPPICALRVAYCEIKRIIWESKLRLKVTEKSTAVLQMGVVEPERVSKNDVLKIFGRCHDSHEKKSLQCSRINRKCRVSFLGSFQVQHRHHYAAVARSDISQYSSDVKRCFERSRLSMKVGT